MGNIKACARQKDTYTTDFYPTTLKTRDPQMPNRKEMREIMSGIGKGKHYNSKDHIAYENQFRSSNKIGNNSKHNESVQTDKKINSIIHQSDSIDQNNKQNKEEKDESIKKFEWD